MLEFPRTSFGGSPRRVQPRWQPARLRGQDGHARRDGADDCPVLRRRLHNVQRFSFLVPEPERHELIASTRLGYSGGEWTACIGDDGKRGVLVETSMADFNELFEVLGIERYS